MVEPPRAAARRPPFAGLLGLGFVTDFLDTLGVGSFATTSTALKLGKLVEDEDIPGTLNVGHSIPTMLEAILYITVIEVELVTLVAMIGPAPSAPGSGPASWSTGPGAPSSARWPSDAAGHRRLHLPPGGPGLPCRRRRPGPHGRRAPGRRRRQRAHRLAHQPRHRQLRPVHGARQPARHEPDRRLPHHDGIGGADPAARRGPLHPGAALRPARRARADARRHSRRAAWRRSSSPRSRSIAVRWLVVGVLIYTSALMWRSALQETA